MVSFIIRSIIVVKLYNAKIQLFWNLRNVFLKFSRICGMHSLNSVEFVELTLLLLRGEVGNDGFGFSWADYLGEVGFGL